MSFFKDFKADFTQAMNELMPDSNEMYDTDDLLEEKADLAGKSENTKKSKKKVREYKGVKRKEKKTVRPVLDNVKPNEKDYIQADEDIAPEDLSEYIDDMLEQELYGEEAGLSDDMEVNTLDTSVEDFLEQLSEEGNAADNDKQKNKVEEKDEQDTLSVDDMLSQLEESTSVQPENPQDSDLLQNRENEVDVSGENNETEVCHEPDMGLEALLDSISPNDNKADNYAMDNKVKNSVMENSMEDGKSVGDETVMDEKTETEVSEEENLDTVELEGVGDESIEAQMKSDSATQEDFSEEAKENAKMQKEKKMSSESDVTAISSVEEETTQKTEETKTEMNMNVKNADSETTYISKGTKIKGDLETDGSVDIIGTVEGNVNCQGKVVVGGQVLGDITAGELYANNANIQGDVKSSGSVKVGVGSMIVGGIEGESAVIAGAINGDIDVKGPVIVDSTAVIMGNIKSRSVQINNGAVIEGFCSQSYSDIDVKSFFA